jgi:hypothetical protein
MNVQLSLQLRKSERKIQIISQNHETQKLSKREHIRELLIKNFFNKYLRDQISPRNGKKDYSMQNQVQIEIDNFMKANPHSINSAALAAFEKQLAAKLKLTRQRLSIPPTSTIDTRNQEPSHLPQLKGSIYSKENLKSTL